MKGLNRDKRKNENRALQFYLASQDVVFSGCPHSSMRGRYTETETGGYTETELILNAIVQAISVLIYTGSLSYQYFT